MTHPHILLVAEPIGYTFQTLALVHSCHGFTKASDGWAKTVGPLILGRRKLGLFIQISGGGGVKRPGVNFTNFAKISSQRQLNPITDLGIIYGFFGRDYGDIQL